MKFLDTVAAMRVEPRTVAIFWLGQAGFLFKTAEGTILLVDPYLSDSVYEQTKEESGYAFKRLTPALFEPEELEADYIFCSHEHGDHLDTGSIAGLMKSGRTRLYTNKESVRLALKAGAPANRITPIERGMELEKDEIRVVTLTAQHGELSPEAMGFLFDFGFTRIYYSGDTSLDMAALAPAFELKPDVVLLPINGAYGNLNATEAAKLAGSLGAAVCIPHHFWTFPSHLGDPQEFIEAMPQYAPQCDLRMLTPGEPFVIF